MANFFYFRGNQVLSELKPLGAMKIHLFVLRSNESRKLHLHNKWKLRSDIQGFFLGG